MQHSRANKTQRGFSLIEVLVALFVLSIGLLGLAALQTTSLQFNTGSYLRTQATFMAYDILDRMRANPTGVTGGDYDIATSGAAAAAKIDATDCTSACDTSQMAAADLREWYTRMEDVLPGSTVPSANYALITRDAATNIVTIQITWIEKDLTMRQTWEVQL